MIQLSICSNDLSQVEEIAGMLLKEKLIVSVRIYSEMRLLELKNGEIEESKVYQMTGKTKALLFPAIDKRIRERYADNIPEIYSLAIVNMDWEQADALISETAKV